MVDRVKSFLYINPYTGEFLSRSQGGLAVVNRASHLCDQLNSGLGSYVCWVSVMSVNLNLIARVFLRVLQFSSQLSVNYTRLRADTLDRDNLLILINILVLQPFQLYKEI